ncbi:MAG: RNA-binding S4 domain-containing protein [Finegoldia sp.]|nr:RNA-binding S4 domain-containing protein [Finegoldia sp.]
MIDVEINTEFIKLDQFLKFQALASTGGMAKELIGEGYVKVNGEVETRRTKKLYPDDVVEFEGEEYRIKA